MKVLIYYDIGMRTWLNLIYFGERFSWNTAQKMKFSIKDFFSKCDEICR